MSLQLTNQISPNTLLLAQQNILLYAEYDATGQINQNNYIVMCRDVRGRVTGLLVSESIQQMYAFEPFVTAEEMLFILSEYERKIAGFCQVFAAEFEQIFALPPDVYFAAARHYWHYRQAS